MRHRPQPVAGGLQGHARVGAQDRGDHQDPPARPQEHHRARLHHRLRDRCPGGDCGLKERFKRIHQERKTSIVSYWPWSLSHNHYISTPDAQRTAAGRGLSR